MRRDPVAVVVLIRSFTDAKARLAGVLGAPERAALARRMAEQVTAAAGSRPVTVVSSAPEVRRWARERGFGLVDDPGSGLDAAAAAGRDAVARAGGERVIVAHADLPRARTLEALASGLGPRTVALVPCHREDGTNVLSVPTGVAFEFAYGPGSFRRHVAEVQRRDLDLVVVRDPDLMVDVDAPEDLVHVEAVAPFPCPAP